MIKELQMCKSGYSEMLEMYLRQIFIRLQRHFEQTIMTDTSQIAEEIDKAIVYLANTIMKQINVDAYAKTEPRQHKLVHTQFQNVYRNYAKTVILQKKN